MQPSARTPNELNQQRPLDSTVEQDVEVLSSSLFTPCLYNPVCPGVLPEADPIKQGRKTLF